jgi:hypothetical protein
VLANEQRGSVAALHSWLFIAWLFIAWPFIAWLMLSEFLELLKLWWKILTLFHLVRTESLTFAEVGPVGTLENDEYCYQCSHD